MKMKRNCENGLRKEVADLSYSHSADLTAEVLASTLAGLEKMWTQYGYADVLGELNHQWPLDKALSFFEKMQFETKKPRTIRTIGTLYHRGYNGGIERVQAQLMSLWIKMGYRVVFFSEEPENPLDFPYPNTVKRILIPKTTDIPVRLLAIQKGITEEKVDVLINHNWGDCLAFWEVMLLKLMDVPYVTYVHALFSWAFPWGKTSLYLPRIHKLCNVVLALSETNARFFQLCGCNTYLVENPVPEDLKQVRQTALLKSRHILMIGRLAKQKCPMETIQAFKLVHDAVPDAILDVVGADEGNYISRMVKYCSENNISDSVVFHGPKTYREVNQFFLDSACMLSTSQMEGYPMVLLEAMAHGLPIAMYDLSFVTIVKEKKGILASPIGDIRGVADSVIRLLCDDALRQNCGRAAREGFEQHSAYDLAGAWEDIFTLCEHSGVVTSKAYYSPADVPEADRFIEPALLEGVAKGYDKICDELNSCIDCRVGRAVLKFPRAVKKLLSKLKGMMIDL